jgi:hypothetical protein
MKAYIRTGLIFSALGVVLFLIWDLTWIRDLFFWTIMMYVVIGSVTGGVRRVMNRFTQRNISYRRSGLGYSWFVLTMWLLRTVFGLSPRERTIGKE